MRSLASPAATGGLVVVAGLVAAIGVAPMLVSGADHLDAPTVGLEPDRAVRMAEAELRVRTDVYGHDALAWALHAAGRTAEGDVAMQRALAMGTREARLLYHAGMIAAALDDAGRARRLLGEALALDPSFDPLQAARARATLDALP